MFCFVVFSKFSLINQLTTRELMSIITDNYRIKSQLLFYYVLALYHVLHSFPHLIKIHSLDAHRISLTAFLMLLPALNFLFLF